MENDTGKAAGLNHINTCTGKMEIPTPREREALSAMKSLKERVRRIKKRIDELKGLKDDTCAEEVLSLKEQLVLLKKEWNALEKKRDAAAKERMILLGHETEE
ncbi:conserved hypothetical protein [delta proteobacterium NaphS2]|nr:conserved hypothetical protein [delta proteobacterium NaphS2]